MNYWKLCVVLAGCIFFLDVLALLVAQRLNYIVIARGEVDEKKAEARLVNSLYQFKLSFFGFEIMGVGNGKWAVIAFRHLPVICLIIFALELVRQTFDVNQ
jgi:hypothetical protein